MAHRPVLTERQRNTLLALPTNEQELLHYYVLSDDDLSRIQTKRKASNRLGFALQLCAFRYPGRLLQRQELIPGQTLAFLAAQLGISEDELATYGQRSETRYEHSSELQHLYGYRLFQEADELRFLDWLEQTAIDTHDNAELAELFVQECRKLKIILPGITVIERLCADARVAAECEITGRITSRLDHHMKQSLYAMLDETVDGRLTVHGWLKRFEVGHNSADVNRLLDKLEYLKKLDIPETVLASIPAHRIIWLRQQGEAYYADGLRNINETRQMAILAVCAIEWRAMLIDAILETHDRIVGKLYNRCKRMRDNQLVDQKKLATETLRSFVKLGKKLLQAHTENASVTDVIDNREALENLMTTAHGLTVKLDSDPLTFVLTGYGKFRRYTQRMLENISFDGNKAAQPLLQAIHQLQRMNQHPAEKVSDLPIIFAASKWRKHMGRGPERKLWETAIFFAIRDHLRSRDIWVHESGAYQDTKQQLLPVRQAEETLSLPIPLKVGEWIKQHQSLLDTQIEQVGRMIRQGTLPNSAIENGQISVKRLDPQTPEGIDGFTLSIYEQMPQVSITDILCEVDKDTGFTDSFTHVHTGSPCSDKIGLLNVLLAGGINMGLKKMALCSSSHTSFWPLLRIANWHVNSETMTNALAAIIDKHRTLPLSYAWGDGTTSSSDGQFFPSGGSGEAMNLINARYGITPGLKGYTHLSDQYGPFAMQTIPATAHEAPFILDGLTMNDTGKCIKEHYADTGGFTDHVFALCSLLGYRFAPRLRNLTSLKLYGMKTINVPKVMRELINAKVNVARIEQQWPDIIRLIASIITHRVVPSDILRQLASFPRQNELAMALREIGRIERTIFILTWISSMAIQRRAQMGLNKGEAHHALKRALNFNRRGEITDQRRENQHLRMMNLNLLAAIIIYWNTKHLGHIIYDKQQRGKTISADKLAHLSPLGWEHIILTGFYKW